MPSSVVYDVVVAIAAAGSVAVTIPSSEADLSLAMVFWIQGRAGPSHMQLHMYTSSIIAK